MPQSWVQPGVKTWTFTKRAEADAMIQRLLAAEPTDDWRDTTNIGAKPATRDESS